MSTLNLVKGERIDIRKSDGGSLSKVFLGLGWDPVTGFLGFGSGGDIDLDASCLMIDANNNLVDTVWFQQLNSRDGSIRHSGDNLTGHGDGDDEVIAVDLSRIPNNVEKLVFTINSYRGHTFDKVKNCFSRLVDYSTNQEIFRYTLSEKGNHTGKIMCMLYRRNGDWKALAVGRATNGRTVRDILPDVVAAIQ